MNEDASPGPVDKPPPPDPTADIAELRTQLAAVRRSNIATWLVLAAVAIAALTVFVIREPPRTTSAAVADRDDSESHLLSAGTRCFHSREEMAAARQRALAAIDRYRWENRIDAMLHPKAAIDVQMFGPSAIHPESTVSIDTPPPGTDDSKCFQVSPPAPGGIYLPPAK